MTSQRSSIGDFDDSDEYLTDWATKLVEALSADELQSLMQDYRRTSRDMTLTKEERRFARRRAKAIDDTM